MSNHPGKVPHFKKLMNPTLKGLKRLGGSGNTREIFDEIVEIMALSDEIVAVPKNENNSYSLVAYNAGWSRNYLKQTGYLEKLGKGVWALTPKGSAVDEVDPNVIQADVKKLYLKKKQKAVMSDKGDDAIINGIDAEEEEARWQDDLLRIVRQIDPAAFERLVGRILRKSGFVRVEVSGRSGDGGIDGSGVLRMGGLLSFKIMFQCKRYTGSVSPREIREFQAAMLGRADKGLYITTGQFTKSARDEATRDGAPAIDLVDGEELGNLLKENGLGISVEMVEKVSIDEEWFANL